MMRRLYSLLLYLYARRVRDEFGAEMLGVFDEASAAERARGASAYGRFCAREVAGLLASVVVPEAVMRHRRFVVYGGIAGLVIGLAVGLAWASRPFTSVAILRTIPQAIPERFVPTTNVSSIDRRISSMTQVILSRGNLINIINTFGLYPAERRRMPAEDVVDIMRNAVEMKPSNGDTIRVAFSYSDPVLAQKVTADLVSRFMAENTRDRTQIAMSTSQFLRDAVQNAGRDWDASLAALATATETRRGYERAKLDADFARQRYESIRGKLADAEMSEQMEKRQQGEVIEVVDPASRPSDDRPGLILCAPVGLVVGALFGLLLSWITSGRVRRVEAEA